jgi:hypothetical protein
MTAVNKAVRVRAGREADLGDLFMGALLSITGR